MCKEELNTGIHNPPTDFPWLLAEAYYHRPEELKAEFMKQKFKHLNTHALEGMIWLDKHYRYRHLSRYSKTCIFGIIYHLFLNYYVFLGYNGCPIKQSFYETFENDNYSFTSRYF